MVDESLQNTASEIAIMEAALASGEFDEMPDDEWCERLQRASAAAYSDDPNQVGVPYRPWREGEQVTTSWVIKGLMAQCGASKNEAEYWVRRGKAQGLLPEAKTFFSPSIADKVIMEWRLFQDQMPEPKDAARVKVSDFVEDVSFRLYVPHSTAVAMMRTAVLRGVLAQPVKGKVYREQAVAWLDKLSTVRGGR